LELMEIESLHVSLKVVIWILLQSFEALVIESRVLKALSKSQLVVLRIEGVNVSSLFLREATELLVVEGPVAVLVHVLEDFVDIAFRDFDSKSINALIKLMDLDVLIIILIKEQKCLSETLEFLFDLDGNQSHDLAQMSLVIFLFQLL
jgi:hypothetical protein